MSYTKKNGAEGRVFDNPFSIIMNKMKVFLPLGVLAILVVAFVSLRGVSDFGGDSANKSLTQESIMMDENVDAFDGALLVTEEEGFDLAELEAILAEESEVNAALAEL